MKKCLRGSVLNAHMVGGSKCKHRECWVGVPAPPGGRGQGGMGKGKGAIVSETCGHLGGLGDNDESPCSAEWPRIANG